MRSSRWVSRMEPANWKRTLGVSSGASGLRSRVMTADPSWESRSISPWPISPLAPVIRTTGLRSMDGPFADARNTFAPGRGRGYAEAVVGDPERCIHHIDDVQPLEQP